MINKTVLAVFVIVLLGLLVQESHGAALSIYEEKKYKQLIDGQGLYGADDDVVILTKHNFKEKLYGQKHAWIIEYYNSWCGFCQRFAPSWKALASDIKGWRDMIKVGAIDCSDDDNSPICRDFEIMSYPTLKYYHENYVEEKKKYGENVEKGVDVNSHRSNLIKYMAQEQAQGRGKMFPQLAPYQHTNLNHLFDDVPINTKYVFLIFENKSSLLGNEVALDLAKVPQIAVKHVSEELPQLAQQLRISKFPQMLVLSDQNKSQLFAGGLNTRESFRMAIVKFLKQNEVTVPEIVTESSAQKYTGKWIEEELPDAEILNQARERKALLEQARKMKDKVFQMDLENAVRSSLRNEVGRIKTIDGDKRDAYINYLTVLIKYFDFGLSGERFLMRLREDAESKSVLDGGQIKAAVEKAMEDGHVFNGPPQWLGCEGSIQGHRGYPCGLWTLFHYLTVNAVPNKGAAPREVLNAMHGFIKNFFGCSDCSFHFQSMAEIRRLIDVSTLDNSIFWLWGAHNEVNLRLAGDNTEDPMFPKVSFPTVELCPECRGADGTSWRATEVLNFLKNRYSSSKVDYLGMKITKPEKISPGFDTSGSISFMRGLDASMLFIIYVASILILVLLIRLFLKRGYRKKMYVHDILGKV